MTDRVVSLEWLRAQIYALEIHPVVAGDQEIRLVADRNRTEKARVLDGVLLDDLWRIWDRAWAAALGEEDEP